MSGGASGGVSGGVSGGASGGGDGAAQGDRRAGTGAGAGAGAGTGAGADAAAAATAAAGWVVVEAEVKKRRRVLASGSTNVSMCVLELQDGIYYGHTYHVYHVAILWLDLLCGDTMAIITLWRYFGDTLLTVWLA